MHEKLCRPVRRQEHRTGYGDPVCFNRKGFRMAFGQQRVLFRSQCGDLAAGGFKFIPARAAERKLSSRQHQPVGKLA